MSFHEIRDAISEQVAHWSREMPDDIRTLISLANSDLYSGPVYLDADGEECTCFDEGARQFDFRDAVAKIGAYLDAVEDIEVETDFDPDTEESFFERVDGTASQIIAGIVGKELASYL